MKITKALREWILKNCEVSEDASDDEIRKAAAGAMVSGNLTAEKYIELTKEPDEDTANEFDKKLDGIAGGLEKLVAVLTAKKEEPVKEKKTEPETKEKKEQTTTKVAAAVAEMSDGDSEEKDTQIRVKEAAEQYSTTKSAMTYPTHTKAGHGHTLAGQPVKEMGRTLDNPSELDFALAGTWAKFQLLTSMRGRSPRFGYEALSDHEKSLLGHLAEKSLWDDSEDGKSKTRVGFPGGLKTLVDDGGASGALEAAPIVFDDMVISAPLLTGELYPNVNVVPLDRGRRIEGVATGNVTGAWGGVDDTAITLFNTNGYITAFDTTIYRWQGAITIGLDFVSDTPIDFGAHITAQYGERLLEDLDDVIAVGNGATQPLGVMNTVGITTVAWGGATSIGNYESLRFSVTKAEHRPNVVSSAVFCGTETSYQRAMALPVGAADARRLHQTNSLPNYDGYSWMNRPYKINSSLSNQQIFYAILARYRMYRRKGLAVRTSTEGDTLIRDNNMLIVVMARFGGQMERAACGAVTTTAPA